MQMMLESVVKAGEDKSADLTERVILLEKAANQLEGDNRDLARKLQETLTLQEASENNHSHEVQRLRGRSRGTAYSLID